MLIPLLLVAHGTREPAGRQEINRIRKAVSSRLPQVAVHICYVDAIAPSVSQVLAGIPGPVVALPAFLASGYHVRADLPQQITAAGRAHDVIIADPLGPADDIAEAMFQRLLAAGWRDGDHVLFSAAGSSDRQALSDVRVAARLLGRRCGQWLAPSYVSTARPLTRSVCQAGVGSLIAPYLLAPGLFHHNLADLPARVAEPIGAHPRVVDLIVRRYRRACGDHRCAA